MINLAVPNLGPREHEYTRAALEQNYVGPEGPFVSQFEEMVAKAAECKWAVATITGTAALHAAALACGIAGKRVEVPEDAFPAARNVLASLGCEVIPRAGGHWHDSAVYVADGCAFVDRAPAIGEKASVIGLECYSFAANKIVTCGQGGAVVGDDPKLEADIRSFIRQGYGLPGKTNYRMANLNAALGCAQMERLDELKAAKKRIWSRYAEQLPMIDRGASRWMATVDLPHEIVPKMAEMGIEARAEPSGGVSLPCGAGLTETEQDEVLRCVTSLS